MLIRLCINVVRWSWGLPSYDFAGCMGNDNLAFLMFFGAIIDAMAIAGVISVAISILDNMRSGKKG